MSAIQTTNSHPVSFAIPVAIYTRVSTLGQVGGRFDSCESQAAICRDFIKKHAAEGWYEVTCHTDAAYSGGTMNRPGIQALKRQIEAGEIKIVVIFKLERVLRSTDEWAPFRALLQKHGCRLMTPTEDHSDDTASGRLKTNLLVSVAEYERRNTGEKVRAKMLEQVKRGMWNCGQVPYGYDYDLTAQTLSPNTTEGAVVGRIYELAAKLVSLTQIANTLNDEGLRTRVRVFKRRSGLDEQVGGKRFRSDLLRKMIKSSIYLGRVRLHGQDYAAKHKALVTDELWERANAAVAKTLRPARSQFQMRDKHLHLLKGLAFCGCCGRALVPNFCGKRGADGKPYRYYTCGFAHKEGTDARCPLRHVSASALEAVVIGFLGEVSRQPAILTAAAERSRLRGKADREPLRVQLAETDQALGNVNRQLKNCVDAITIGGADFLGDELRERVAGLKEKKQQLLVERERLKQDLSACDQDVVNAQRIGPASDASGAGVEARIGHSSPAESCGLGPQTRGRARGRDEIFQAPGIGVRDSDLPARPQDTAGDSSFQPCPDDRFGRTRAGGPTPAIRGSATVLVRVFNPSPFDLLCATFSKSY